MKNLTVVFALLFLSVTFFQPKAYAQQTDYSVQAILPETQMDKNKSYFDLLLQAGTTQTLSLSLVNHSEEAITLKIEPNTASTNKNGVIDYSFSEKKVDSTTKINFKDLVTGPEKVTLSPKEVKKVSYEVTMPKEEMDGTILGGFYISQLTNETSESSEQSMITNKVSYAIAVSIIETQKKVEAELELTKVKPGLANYRTTVNATIQNTKPVIVKGMAVSAKIRKVGSEKILHETTKEQLAMAPNSKFDFPISWDNQALEPGEYVLSMEVSSSSNEWAFEKTFTIEKKEAETLNKEAVDVEKNSNWQVIVGGLLAMVILFLSLLLWREKRRKK